MVSYAFAPAFCIALSILAPTSSNVSLLSFVCPVSAASALPVLAHQSVTYRIRHAHRIFNRFGSKIIEIGSARSSFAEFWTYARQIRDFTPDGGGCRSAGSCPLAAGGISCRGSPTQSSLRLPGTDSPLMPPKPGFLRHRGKFKLLTADVVRRIKGYCANLLHVQKNKPVVVRARSCTLEHAHGCNFNDSAEVHGRRHRR